MAEREIEMVEFHQFKERNIYGRRLFFSHEKGDMTIH